MLWCQCRMWCRWVAASKVEGEALSSYLKSQLCRNFVFVTIFLAPPKEGLILTCVDGFLKVYKNPGRQSHLHACENQLSCELVLLTTTLSWLGMAWHGMALWAATLSWLGSMSSHFLVIFDQIKVRTCRGFFATASSMKYPWIKLLAKNKRDENTIWNALPKTMEGAATNKLINHKKKFKLAFF